ncbi:MAG: Rne/Rng family ribonuclease [Deltaproteobacteria bacterium]|nr:Rne/Rng family ribonuclease [Deltaproteobacteria bacterium]
MQPRRRYRSSRPKKIEKSNKVREFFLDSNPFERRLALSEGERLKQYYVERDGDRGISGNIYKGTVVSVLPGMQAAFVEIGLERTAFLHVSDIMDSPDYFRGFDDSSADSSGDARGEKRTSRHDQPNIQDKVKKGQEIMVQVAKEPIGSKGARITSYVSLPGRYLVLMPTYDRIGVSRRIGDERERRRLKKIVSSVKPKGCGFIIRTVCEGMTEEEVKSDMDFLLKLWKITLDKMEKSKNPSVIYEEPDLTLRTIRDSFSKDIKRMVIEPKEEFDRAAAFVEEYMPDLRPRIELYEGGESMFDSYGIEVELAEALEKQVWLPSGGSIVMDQMEALTAIDVNTGKYVGKKNSELTILKTNLEAVGEIVHQLMLRNIGGIIVIDFIDMDKIANREKVYRTLKDALRVDKARTNILKVSELGVIEMTRKRTRESLSQTLLEACPYCDGGGLVKNKSAIAMDIYRDLTRELERRRAKVVLYVNPSVAEILREKNGVLDEMNKRFKKRVTVKTVDVFHQEEYELI